MNIRTKADALALFGGRQGVAKALGIRPHAVSQWPDELRSRLIDELVGAAWRLGLMWKHDLPITDGRQLLLFYSDGTILDVEWSEGAEKAYQRPDLIAPIPPLPAQTENSSCFVLCVRRPRLIERDAP